MCGIIACQVDDPALGYIVPALRRLEYRGYDSAGVAVRRDDGRLAVLRSVGRLESLQERISGYSGPALNGTGIGHTRWATHGGVNERNAHPHLDCVGRVAIVHNGIIENADVLRAELAVAGHQLRSEGDSEVVAHLVEDRLAASDDLIDAVRTAVGRLTGSWALAVLDSKTNRLVVTTHRCPLIVARSSRGDFAASDMSALLEWVDSVQVLRDGDIVELGGSRIWTGFDGPRLAPAEVKPGWSPQDVDRGSFADYMSKEIAEQPAVAARIIDAMAGGIGNGRLWRELELPELKRVRMLACGTSLHAGMAIARVLQTLGGIPAQICTASEGSEQVLEPGTLTIAISQSGETADVLRALDATPGDLPVLALTNTAHSSLARRADAVVDCSAGPEVGVAATKTFTAQVISGVAVALSALVASGRVSDRTLQPLLDSYLRSAQLLRRATELTQTGIEDLAPDLAGELGFLFLARGGGLPYAAEGALKLKEISYRWAEAYPAGELKHGPIALIGSGTPVVVVDDGNPKLAGNIAEVAARGARVISIGGPGTTFPVVASPTPPWGPLESVVVLQHLARSIALVLGRDVDKPRNLAKSVTVE
jgi:glutamine---fructose-6-phosphate transaminase (isomerizing)